MISDLLGWASTQGQLHIHALPITQDGQCHGLTCISIELKVSDEICYTSDGVTIDGGNHITTHNGLSTIDGYGGIAALETCFGCRATGGDLHN
jgi:hypothetical protein